MRTQAHEKFWRKGTAQFFGIPPIIWGTHRATNFKFGKYIDRVHANKSPLKCARKGIVGVSRDFPNFLSTLYYLRNGQRYELHIWQMYSECPRKQKPLNYLREKGAWAYPGTAQISWVPPIISGTRKATNFKFGRYSYRVHPNKSLLKIWEKREHGHIQDCQNFWSTPLLSQEGVKLRTSNFVRTFLASIRTNAHYKFREK